MKNPEDLQQSILVYIEVLVAAACAMSGDAEKKGGHLCVTDGQGNLLFEKVIGEIPDPEKAAKYGRLALEKCQRLANNPLHVSSWQSRNEGEEKYGGAIRVNDSLFFGFSGLPELLDEAVVLTSAVMSADMTLCNVQLVVRASNNYDFAGKLLPENTLS